MQEQTTAGQTAAAAAQGAADAAEVSASAAKQKAAAMREANELAELARQDSVIVSAAASQAHS